MPNITETTSDGPIIAEVLSGRTEQFAVIVRRYQHALMRVAKSRLGRADWAEDVVQETFLCAFKSLASYDSRFSFRTWLWTILLNQCRRAYQKGQRRANETPWNNDHQEENDNRRQCILPPDTLLLAKERAENLQRLLADLPEVQADALRLRFFGGLKFQEIADTMGCGLSTAKHRVRCGLMSLSEQLAGESI